MKINNAIKDSINNSIYENEATTIAHYITTGINNNTPLSLIIAESADKLNYIIHPESFFCVMQVLIEDNPKEMLTYLRNRDDVGLYTITEAELIKQNANAFEIYTRIPELSRSNSPIAVSNSAYEEIFDLTELTFKLFLYLIPSILFFLYSYKYYYKYKIKMMINTKL